ncbi:MAG: Ty1/Copia family ribonuclease HI, partial [Acidimicrobiales bacterium]
NNINILELPPHLNRIYSIPKPPIISTKEKSESSISFNSATQNITAEQHVSAPEINTHESNSLNQSDQISENTIIENSSEQKLRRSTRNKKIPGEWWKVSSTNSDLPSVQYAFMINSLEGTDSPSDKFTPKSYKEAIKYPHWKASINKEYGSLTNNGTWILTILPPGRKTIKCKWIFKVKENADGTVSVYKTRLVACGYSQIFGVDYFNTYAPTIKLSTVRAILAVAAKQGYNITQADVVTAYLHAAMTEEVYMDQPEGFEQKGENGETLVCLLKKSIYGLKQAGRNWNKFLDTWFKGNKFKVGGADPCLYIYTDDKGNFVVIGIHVDDFIIIDNNLDLRQKFIQDMSKTFKLDFLGDAKWILQVKLTRTANSITIDQSKYIADILEKFDMINCKVANTPMEKTIVKSDLKCDKSDFMSLVGKLIYVSVVTRPDIAYAVSTIGQSSSDPSLSDFIAAKRILRYLKGTIDLGIKYSKSSSTSNSLFGFSDSDWANDKTRKSTTGYVFIFANAAISWSSRKQPTIALSSTEAEYMAGCNATQELLYLRMLFQDLGQLEDGPTLLFQDNQGAINLANDFFSTKRTKHIDVKFHFIRQHIKEGRVKVNYIPTSDMVADCLTKPVGKIILEKCKVIIFGLTVFH